MKDKKYLNIVEAQEGDWTFENQTTACVIKLKLKDADGESEIWMEYHPFRQLKKLIDKITE